MRDAYGRCIPSDCESYHDGCNTCSVRNGLMEACTEMFCETPGPPRCLDVVGGPTGDKDQDNCCGGGSACGYVLVEGKCVHASEECLRDAYDRCVPDDCESYFDGCNTCSVGAKGLGCTLMYCETPSGSIWVMFGMGLGGRFGVGSGLIWGRFGVSLGSVRG